MVECVPAKNLAYTIAGQLPEMVETVVDGRSATLEPGIAHGMCVQSKLSIGEVIVIKSKVQARYGGDKGYLVVSPACQMRFSLCIRRGFDWASGPASSDSHGKRAWGTRG